MYKTIKVRLYPTVKQKQMLDEHFNVCRFAYNLCLEYKSTMWKYYRINKTGFDMQKELSKIRNNTDWIKACKAECVMYSCLKVEKSFKNFFSGMGYPKFKSKFDEQSFFSSRRIHVKDDKISFFSRKIKMSTSKYYSELLSTSKLKFITFTRDKSGCYYACCMIEFEPIKLTHSTKSVGIDLGLKELIVTSNGDTYPNNRYLQNTRFRIKKLQRKFSKCKKRSSNKNKIRIKIARLHSKVVNQREHYYHQISNQLIRDNQTIVLETLRIQNMTLNHNLAAAINDASWGLMTRFLEYKANWYGRSLIKIDTFYPSTKTCSNCGNVKDVLLSERTYNCECGLSLDRDHNAAINIRNMGLKIPFKPAEISGYAIGETESRRLKANTILITCGMGNPALPNLPQPPKND